MCVSVSVSVSVSVGVSVSVSVCVCVSCIVLPMSGYPEDLHNIVCKNFDDFSKWAASAPRASLSQALEITKEKVHEWIKKQMELESALEKNSDPGSPGKGIQENTPDFREKVTQREWKEGDRASIAWEDEGVHIFWPGTITKKQNFVRVRVMDETGLVEMQDCSTGTDYISPLRQHVLTERDKEDPSAFVHSVSFKTQTATHIITSTLTVTNKEEKLAVGKILEWEFNSRVPGLPNWFSFQLDGEGGCKSKLEGAQFEEYKSWHIAPDPIQWPPNGVLLEQVGSSRLGFENCYEKSTGIAIFVKVCAFEDRNQVQPTALAKVFCHPGCKTEIGASLPAGLYHIRVAEGHKWEGDPDKKAAFYGDKYLFGPAGFYMKDYNPTQLKPLTNLTISYPAGGGGTLISISQEDM